MLFDKELKAYIPTTKPKEAKAFYKDLLGLMLLSEDENALEFRASGILLRLMIVQELEPQPFAVLGWRVKDISDMTKSLVVKGISFERYEVLKQDDQGIWKSPGGSKVAWFKDPDGNILSLTENQV
jgi:catechol 2,3-dioxygenase-like lactoylglutathione lyase family enzyme